MLNLTDFTDRLAPWGIWLSEIDFEVVHRNFYGHQAAGSLSQLFTNVLETILLKDATLFHAIDTRDDVDEPSKNDNNALSQAFQLSTKFNFQRAQASKPTRCISNAQVCKANAELGVYADGFLAWRSRIDRTIMITV